MSLWKVKTKLKGKDKWESKIVYSESKTLSMIPYNDVSGISVTRVMYKHTHIYSPIIFKSISGQHYILPDWIPCHPQTTREDIIWEKKIEKKIEKNVFEVKSSSNDLVYKVTKNGDKFTCNCTGFWRLKDKNKGCKHVQQIKTEHKF